MTSGLEVITTEQTFNSYSPAFGTNKKKQPPGGICSLCINSFQFDLFIAITLIQYNKSLFTQLEYDDKSSKIHPIVVNLSSLDIYDVECSQHILKA